MKKLVSFLLITAMLCALIPFSVISAFAANDKVNYKVDIPYVETAPKIDGVVKKGEYGKALPLHTYSEAKSQFEDTEHNDYADGSIDFDFHMAWDKDNLYMAWVVKSPNQNGLPEKDYSGDGVFDEADYGYMWQYSCVEFILVPGAPKAGQTNFQQGDYFGNYLEVGLCLTDANRQCRVAWSKPAGAEALDPNDWDAVIVKNDNKTMTYEVCIPWSKSGVKEFGNSAQFGLAYAVAAQEHYETKKGMIEWQDCILGSRKADNAAVVTLTGFEDSDATEEAIKAAIGSKNADASCNVDIYMPANYQAGDEIVVDVKVTDININNFSGVSFDLCYDATELKLISAVNSDNSIDCISKIPSTAWENLTVCGDDEGVIEASVFTTKAGDVFAKKDGDITLAFKFKVLDTAKGKIGVYAAHDTVTCNSWDDPATTLKGNGSYALSAYHEHKYIVEKSDAKQHKYVCACGKVIYEAHTFESTVTKPTCEGMGYTTHTCKFCGESYADSYINALGHKPGDWVIVKEAANGEDGLKEKYCTVCGKTVESEVIPAYIKGDANGDGKINAVDYALAKRHVLKTWKLEGVNFKAADLNGDGKITANEYALIKRHVLKTYVIPQ